MLIPAGPVPVKWLTVSLSLSLSLSLSHSSCPFSSLSLSLSPSLHFKAFAMLPKLVSEHYSQEFSWVHVRAQFSFLGLHDLSYDFEFLPLTMFQTPRVKAYGIQNCSSYRRSS